MTSLLSRRNGGWSRCVRREPSTCTCSSGNLELERRLWRRSRASAGSFIVLIRTGFLRIPFLCRHYGSLLRFWMMRRSWSALSFSVCTDVSSTHFCPKQRRRCRAGTVFTCPFVGSNGSRRHVGFDATTIFGLLPLTDPLYVRDSM